MTLPAARCESSLLATSWLWQVSERQNLKGFKRKILFDSQCQTLKPTAVSLHGVSAYSEVDHDGGRVWWITAACPISARKQREPIPNASFFLCLIHPDYHTIGQCTHIQSGLSYKFPCQFWKCPGRHIQRCALVIFSVHSSSFLRSVPQTPTSTRNLVYSLKLWFTAPSACNTSPLQCFTGSQNRYFQN